MNFNRHALSLVEFSQTSTVPRYSFFLFKNVHPRKRAYWRHSAILKCRTCVKQSKYPCPGNSRYNRNVTNSRVRIVEKIEKFKAKIFSYHVLFLKRTEFKRSMNHDLFFFLCIYTCLNSTIFINDFYSYFHKLFKKHGQIRRIYS